MKIAQAITEAASVLQRAGVEQARREAASLLAHSTGRERAFLIAHSDARLAPHAVARFQENVMRRARGEPLQYITGHQEFFGLDFEVTKDTLIPRPETELLVETALELFDPLKECASLICDVGTGSGCISIALLHARQTLRVVGLDISPAALRIARRNSHYHKVQDRLKLIASDCFTALDARHAKFALIVSNPPYVADCAFAGLQREVRDYEPRTALTSGADGLTVIRQLLEDAPYYLMSSGYMIFEIGYDQYDKVKNLIDAEVWKLLDIREDLQGIPRTVVLKKK
jgi:release factor glutamine methyltransferase